jgi:hypothetical protein
MSIAATTLEHCARAPRQSQADDGVAGAKCNPRFARVIVSQVVRAAFDAGPSNGMWDLIYIGLMLAGTGAAFALVQRRVTAPNVAATLFALSLLGWNSATSGATPG